MNTSFLKSTLKCAIALIALTTVAPAALIIVDTFDQGGYFTNNRNPVEQNVMLNYGTRRRSAFGGSSLLPSTVSSSVNTSAGQFEISIFGTNTNPRDPLRLELIYTGDELYDISTYTELILGFTEMRGTGNLYVELGSSNGFTNVIRKSLTGPGDLEYPVADVWANPGHDLEAFNVLRFIFESTSNEFSFTLDEIRLVPEPGTAALLGLAALASSRRKRHAL